MQLVRQISPCKRLGVVDNLIAALPFTPGGNSIPASHAIPALSQNAMHSYVPGPSAETPNETPYDGQYSWQGPSRYHGGHEFQPEPYSRIGHTAQSAITRSVADPAMHHESLNVLSRGYNWGPPVTYLTEIKHFDPLFHHQKSYRSIQATQSHRRSWPPLLP